MTIKLEMLDTRRPALHTITGGVRCWACGRKIANVVTAPYSLDCRCGAKNEDDTALNVAYSQ